MSAHKDFRYKQSSHIRRSLLSYAFPCLPIHLSRKNSQKWENKCKIPAYRISITCVTEALESKAVLLGEAQKYEFHPFCVLSSGMVTFPLGKKVAT